MKRHGSHGARGHDGPDHGQQGHQHQAEDVDRADGHQRAQLLRRAAPGGSDPGDGQSGRRGDRV